MWWLSFFLFFPNYFLWNLGLSRTANTQVGCINANAAPVRSAWSHDAHWLHTLIPCRQAYSAFWKGAEWLSLPASQAVWLMLRLFHGSVTIQMFLYQQKVLLYSIFDNVQNWGNSWVSIKTTRDAVIWKPDLALEWHWFPHFVNVVTEAPNVAASTAYARVNGPLLITRNESFPSSKYFYQFDSC